MRSLSFDSRYSRFGVDRVVSRENYSSKSNVKTLFWTFLQVLSLVQIRTRLEISAAQAEEESDVSTLDAAFHFSFVKFGEMKTNRRGNQADKTNKNKSWNAA